ncbi:MAG TPA: tetratricopeptide repeat protein [Thermoflexia bacterium]|nr:tetratricopeptide repeat protein [Thermoflexia bacterium]
MFNLNRLVDKLGLSTTEGLLRAVRTVAVALIVTVVLFGGYYYWDRYVRIGDRSPLELSIEQLEHAVREDPANPDLRVALAERYLNAGQYERALEQAQQVLEVYPENEGALLVAGLACMRLDRPQEALEPLETFVELRKGRPTAGGDLVLETAYYYLGDAYLRLDRPTDAIEMLEAAITINRTDADAFYLLGRAYQKIDDLETALKCYLEAVRFVPDFAEAYAGMAEIYEAWGEPDYLAYARGMQAFSARDYETARSYLEQATSALPDFPQAFLGLALTYEQLGDLEAALEAAQRALELQPDDLAVQHTVGRIQTALGAQQ